MKPGMSPERWQRISALLDEVLDLPAEQRSAYLERACSGNPALKDDVETLLKAGREAGSFLEEGAAARAPAAGQRNN